jgi:hypothetical protein
VTAVEVWTLVYVDGIQKATGHAVAEHIPSMISGDDVSAVAVRSARLASADAAKLYPTWEEIHHGE